MVPRGLATPSGPAKSAGRNKVVNGGFEDEWLLQIEQLIIRIGYLSFTEAYSCMKTSKRAADIAENFAIINS